METPKEATAATRAANRAVLGRLPTDDGCRFRAGEAWVCRHLAGCSDREPQPPGVVWDLAPFAFENATPSRRRP